MYLDEFHAEHPDNRDADVRSHLLQLKPSDHTYIWVETQLRQAWTHPNKSVPYVHAVFKIVYPGYVLKPYLDCKKRVEERLGVYASTEELLFHGTTRGCKLGDGSRQPTRLCNLSECCLCGIIRGSYDLNRAGSKHKFRRFGQGIYITSCSSKADDYTSNKAQKVTSRVLLLNRVVVGNAHRRQHNATNLTRPPPGYDSIIGEPGAHLNYEETVIYDNDAIRPAYLVVYGDQPIKHEFKSQPKFGSIAKMLFGTPLVQVPGRSSGG